MRVGDGPDADGDGVAVTVGLGLAEGVGVLSGVFVVGTPAGGGTAGIARIGAGADRRTCGRAWVGWASAVVLPAPPARSGAVDVGSAAATDTGGGVRSAVRLPGTAAPVLPRLAHMSAPCVVGSVQVFRATSIMFRVGSGVSVTLRPARSNRRVPRRVSRFLMAWLTALVVMFS